MASPASFLRECFAAHYGAARAVRVFRGPGRVNLIGEHTDYNLGFVMPMALDMACYTAWSPGRRGLLRVFSENLQESREWPLSELETLRPAGDWGDYVAGVARELALAGMTVEPANLAVWSTVPTGSGLSSSAALEVSVALALLGGRTMPGLELAKLCQRAENVFAGMPCGIMDQYVSVFGRPNSAIRIDCRNLTHAEAPLPRDAEIVAVNSMVKHELGQSAYRNRVRECSSAVEHIRRCDPKVESLRDVREEEFDFLSEGMEETARKRARHVITENARVERFTEACRQGDLGQMGELLTASHRSLQHDYQVSCEELDFIVDQALDLSGVYGARMTGGGFGGCVIGLVKPEKTAHFESAIANSYHKRFGVEPKVFVCRPAAGAGELV